MAGSEAGFVLVGFDGGTLDGDVLGGGVLGGGVFTREELACVGAGASCPFLNCAPGEVTPASVTTMLAIAAITAASNTCHRSSRNDRLFRDRVPMNRSEGLFK